MRRRYQKGSLQLRKQGGVWVWLGMWREGEHRRTKTLGQKSEMTKAEAKAVLDRILAPLNARQEPQTGKMQLGAYIRDVYYPFCRRKWKRSTRMTTEDRINHHIVPEVGDSALRSISRVVLQDLLDRKAADGLSFSVVTHLRWDLRHMFRIAVGEGFIERNPAELLFTPQAAKRATQRVAAAEEIVRVFASVDLRERLILKLAGIAGMRPGEIFGLKWANLEPPFAEIRQRVYRGDIDSPKSPKSIRKAALGESLLLEIVQWRALCVSTAPDAWVFPSEVGTTPLRKDNVWRRHIGPKLTAMGLGWINFQVLRRSCSSLLSDLGVDGKVVADQLGHTLDVNQNVYTRVGFDRQAEAVNRLDSALRVN
jgi:integrase